MAEGPARWSRGTGSSPRTWPYRGRPTTAAVDAGIPRRCQGSDSPATVDDPGVCKFSGKSYDPTEWVLEPGLYPGGLELDDGTFYLLPGIYWIGGGGLKMVGGGATVDKIIV